MSTVTGLAPAKLLLFGEHAAVYGHPSLGVALPQSIYVSIAPADSFHWVLQDDAEQYRQKLDLLLLKLREVFPHLRPAMMSMRSTIPLGVGFGSSGALCVACVKAIAQLMEIKLSDDQIWGMAHECEEVFHHRPSGIDTGLATFGGICCFEGIPAKITRLSPPENVMLVVGALKRSGDTAAIVKGLADKRESNPKIDGYLTHLGQLAKEAVSHLRDSEQLAKLATEAHSHLKDLGLSNVELDEVLKVGLKEGGLGGKLSGAGGGGAYYIVVRSEDIGANVIQRIKNSGFDHAFDPRVILI